MPAPVDDHSYQLGIAELQHWLQNWVMEATGLGKDEVSTQTPLEQLGLSSRDAVRLSGDLEQLLGRRLDATLAYEHPTIAALAQHLLSAPSPRKPLQTSSTETGDPAVHDIAVVGMSARYPGAASATELWQLVLEGRSAVGEPPAGRWQEYQADEVMRQRMRDYSLTGGYLDDIASFDAEFFGLSPLEATNMDPQQRIMLELTWEALEDAGIAPNTLRGEPVGVFYGSTNHDYAMLIASDPARAHPYALTGTSGSVIPNRVSYAFDFRGPSVNVDTACSSSLVAVHQAVRALREGEASVALAGGVNILASPYVTTAFAELGVISPSGGIRAFSDDADGIVRSDGAGVLVLKRVRDAVAEGDDILAVIKGSAINSDGHSNGLTAPNPEAQADVLRRAYADAGIDPATVDYVEAHGTGTILGDPIEATALGEVLGRGRSVDEPLLLGSAKTNFGHTEAAAGAAGMIKVVAGLQHNVLAPTTNFTAPNRYIDFDAERLEVVEDPREWPAYGGTRSAGVSGFGFGGTNAHVVLSEYCPEDYNTESKIPEAQLAGGAAMLAVSGLLPSRRKAMAQQLTDYLEQHPDLNLVQVERTLAGRNHGRTRAVVQASTHEEAVERLRRVAQGKTGSGVTVSDSPQAQGPVFVYSGFGSQYRKMAKDLMALSPLFAQRMRVLDELVQHESGWSMCEIIDDDSQTYGTETAQVTITAIQIALTDLLVAAGVQPAGVMGMSMGEIAAAYAAGGLSAEDAMLIACNRSRLMGEGESSLSEDQAGAMAVVEATPEEIDGVEVAVYTAPGMLTVGGSKEKVEALVAERQAAGKFARALNVRGAGHTSALDPILGELAAEISGISPQPLEIPLYSSVVRGRVFAPGEVVHDADYFITCTRRSVWFQDATQQAFAHGHDTLVEIAPNPVALMGMMNTAFASGKPDAHLLYSLKRKVESAVSLRDLLAQLYVQGSSIDFRILNGCGPRAELPGQLWQRSPYWTSARPASGATGLPGTKVVLPGDMVAYSTDASQVPSALSLIDAAVSPRSVTATKEYSQLPPSGEVTTIVRQSIGGLHVEVYAVDGSSTELVAEGFASLVEVPAQPAAPVEPAIPAAEAETDAVRWDPETETVEERLRAIVSESMGYDAEDLPLELPLIDLGLDSLMGMRIKNRIEHDFQIPPLNVQALRDASAKDVISMVEDAVAGRPPSDAPEPSAEPTSSSGGVGVAPRDASERLVFATWAGITGQAASGITSELPQIDEATAEQIAQRLTERAGIEVTAADVLAATTLEPLADRVREGLETDVEGNVRVLRERPEGSTAPAVIMFHPAGGSSVVYQPLMRRLPAEVPVYGMERFEGTLEERAEAYVEDIKQLGAEHPVILGGWSFGGALAYEVARLLQGSTVQIAAIALLDTVQPANPAPDTPEETRKRWERYQAFAKKTYGIDIPVPYDLLESQGEDALLGMLTHFLATTDAGEHGLAAGVLEHQRASFVDNRILDRLDFARWKEVQIPVVLYRAERMHDGAIELEPAYEHVNPDGGWGRIVDDLEIIQLHGDHLSIVDEPEIATVGKHLTGLIRRVVQGVE